MSQRYKISALSGEECFALSYVQAMIGGPGSMAYKGFVKGERALQLSADDKKQALRKGLNLLLAKGIIEGKKNGEGDYEPTVLHMELLDGDTSNLLVQ